MCYTKFVEHNDYNANCVGVEIRDKLKLLLPSKFYAP